MRLSGSREDYLETIYELIEKNAVARVKDIAARLNVSKPSVHCAISEFKKHGLVEQEPYGYITLIEWEWQKQRKLSNGTKFCVNFCCYSVFRQMLRNATPA